LELVPERLGTIDTAAKPVCPSTGVCDEEVVPLRGGLSSDALTIVDAKHGRRAAGKYGIDGTLCPCYKRLRFYVQAGKSRLKRSFVGQGAGGKHKNRSA
jgi:hypothetical protein